MGNLLLIPLCLAAGFLLKRLNLFPKNTSDVLNVVIIWVSFPALVLVQMPVLVATIRTSHAMLVPVLAIWVAFGLAALFVSLAGRHFKWSRHVIGALILTTGLGNTSFIGFPLIEAFYGQEGLQYALIVDQAGSFLVLSTLGILCASYFSGARVSLATVITGIFKFPPFVAILLGLALSGSTLMSELTPTLERLKATLVPLVLLSVGCQMHFDPRLLRRRADVIGFGLALKLVIIPLLFAVGLWAMHGNDLACRVSLVEVAMGPMITAAIIATQFGLDREIASLMVGVGVPLSICTVWLWHALL